MTARDDLDQLRKGIAADVGALSAAKERQDAVFAAAETSKVRFAPTDLGRLLHGSRITQ